MPYGPGRQASAGCKGASGVLTRRYGPPHDSRANESPALSKSRGNAFRPTSSRTLPLPRAVRGDSGLPLASTGRARRLASMPITPKPVVEMDVRGDYVLSYRVQADRSSRRSNPDRRRRDTGKERVAVRREVPGKVGHGEGYVWTERRGQRDGKIRQRGRCQSAPCPLRGGPGS